MYNFQPYNLYDMDEKGILLGVHSRAQVAMCRRHRSPIEKMDGSREWIAVVGCICADNSLLPKGLYHGWFTKVNDQNAKSAHFDKGHMADEAGNRVVISLCHGDYECVCNLLFIYC